MTEPRFSALTGFVCGERGDECLEGEVVDRSRGAPAGLMDQRGGVVGEQGVAASGKTSQTS
jgi:hypothetical protein